MGNSLQAKIHSGSLHTCLNEQDVLSVFPSFIDSPFNSPDYLIFPGFCDVHVHFREPGFSYKGTILQGSRAAAHGGYTDVCAMPNLKPVPDNLPHLLEELSIIERDSIIHTHAYGSITVGQKGEALADLASMAEKVVAFSDDGRGVQDDEMMRNAMILSKKLGKIITAHCEVNSLLRGGYIHDGEYARSHGHKGICSESEWQQIARDIALSRETGCPYHVCHISTKESVEIIRQAKQDGIDITCETAPHYLILDDSMLLEEGRFKMNPPIRSKADRDALIEGVLDGTIDMIATDHAPHSEEEKSKGLSGSLNGIVGLECAFQVLYTYLVKPGIVPLDRIVEMLTVAPRKRFSIPYNKDFTVWNLNASTKVDSTSFLSGGKATPFDGMDVIGKCVLTVCDGKIAFSEGC